MAPHNRGHNFRNHHVRGGGITPANADYALKLSLQVANASPSPIITSTDYQLIIPASFSIDHSGWNEITDGITAKLSGDDFEFDSGYKLTVTASHGALTASGIDDTITYTLKTASTDEGEVTTWEFSAAEINVSKDNKNIGTTKTLGVDVADYSSKPNGNYESTITFTAEAEALVKVPTLADLNTDGSTLTITFECNGGNTVTFTNNGGSFSDTGHSGFAIQAARMYIQDGNFVAQFDAGFGDFSDSVYMLTVTLNPDNNTWTASSGDYLNPAPSNYTFTVNGTDITDSLTQN